MSLNMARIGPTHDALEGRPVVGDDVGVEGDGLGRRKHVDRVGNLVELRHVRACGDTRKRRHVVGGNDSYQEWGRGQGGRGIRGPPLFPIESDGHWDK